MVLIPFCMFIYWKNESVRQLLTPRTTVAQPLLTKYKQWRMIELGRWQTWLYLGLFALLLTPSRLWLSGSIYCITFAIYLPSSSSYSRVCIPLLVISPVIRGGLVYLHCHTIRLSLAQELQNLLTCELCLCCSRFGGTHTANWILLQEYSATFYIFVSIHRYSMLIKSESEKFQWRVFPLGFVYHSLDYGHIQLLILLYVSPQRFLLTAL